MDFRSPYRHGFLRVAACTISTTIAQPAANAEAVLPPPVNATTTASGWPSSPS